MHANSSMMEGQKAYKYNIFSTVNLTSFHVDLNEHNFADHSKLRIIIITTSKFIIQNKPLMTILLHLN